MIAVKAVYERGRVKLLEPAPPLKKALAVVVFLEDYLGPTVSPSQEDTPKTIEWGQPIDEEGAQLLVAIHEELAPYRLEAEDAYLNRGEP
jgi:hypothetical protein